MHQYQQFQCHATQAIPALQDLLVNHPVQAGIFAPPPLHPNFNVPQAVFVQQDQCQTALALQDRSVKTQAQLPCVLQGRSAPLDPQLQICVYWVSSVLSVHRLPIPVQVEYYC